MIICWAGYSSIRNKDAADTPTGVHPQISDSLKAIETALAESSDVFIPGHFEAAFEELDYLCDDIVNLSKAYHRCLDAAYRQRMSEKITKDFLNDLSNNNASAILNMSYRSAFNVPMNIRKPATKKARGYLVDSPLPFNYHYMFIYS